MYVKEIWRYPVKSMAGEQLERANLTHLGIEGDRVVLVLNGHGRIVTARSHPALLGHKGTTSAAGIPMVDGRPWTDSAVLTDVRKIAGPRADERDATAGPAVTASRGKCNGMGTSLIKGLIGMPGFDWRLSRLTNR